MVSPAEFDDRQRSFADPVDSSADLADVTASRCSKSSSQAGTVNATPPMRSICKGDAIPAHLLTLRLPDLLQRAAKGTTGILAVQPDGTQFQSYAELFDRAQRILAGLRATGLQPQDKVILQLRSPQDFLAGFWGCVLGGFVPVPIAVPPSYALDTGKTSTLRYAVQLLERATIITHQTQETALRSVVQSSDGTDVVAIEVLLHHSPDPELHRGELDQLALILLTSGSTGTPKGVMLSAQNLLVSASGMATVNRLSENSVSLNWMPLEHVASLVMFHLTEVFVGCQQIQVANEIILQDPLRWLDLVDQHRVTTTWAPNFAYGLVNDRAADIQQRQWNLSCIDWMGNGAEAVVGKTTRRFLELLMPHGLGKTAVSPGYGMSETCSGIIHSHRFSLETTSEQDAFVSVGTPIPGVCIRIVDDNNQVVDEGTIGLLQVKGLTVTAGYYNRPDLNAEIFTPDGWFNTGDLGFLDQGCLTITGRQKEVIIVNGVNYYSHEIEAIVEELPDVQVSYTAACAVRQGKDSTDRLAVFFSPAGWQESAVDPMRPPKSPNTGGLPERVPSSIGGVGGLRGVEGLSDLVRAVRRQVVERLGISPDYVLPVPSAWIPKTAIGKIQRRQLSQRFQAGEFDELLNQMIALQKQQPQNLPRNPLEVQIATVWREVLQLEQVSVTDSFFELGGNSLRLLQVLHQLQQAGHSLSVVELFEYPSIAALAQHLSQPQPTVPVQSSRPRSQPTTSTGIAVIGMDCRFPGADSIEQFWHNLCNGVESISFFTDEEILNSGVDAALLQHPHYVKASPILSDVAGFDAEFFGYSTREAEVIDPQQRLLLECAWNSLEDAGYNPFTYAGAIGLYAGASMNTYLLNHVYPNRHKLDDQDELQVVTLGAMGGLQMTIGNDKDYLTTRVSYKLNLTGPSVNVQTACSTSLVAIHLAAQSLLNGECDMALAGGVSVHTPQKVGHLYQEGMILTPDGHCRAFDAQARGTIFGSGVGLVVLKRLEAAIADRDQIYAVIKGSAIGNDGSSKVGYLAPSATGQATVAATALSLAGIDPATLGYVEAHGTGTELGDPIEIAGLTQAFRTATQQQFCAIGSVKTNVGHLNIASGVVGFIKTVLALHHKQIPPSLHFQTPNPRIDFAHSPFYVNTALTNWQAPAHPRRAGVNSLGIGGTNAHVVLEEWGEESRQQAEGERVGWQQTWKRPWHLLTLSAKSQTALRELAARYEGFLTAHPDLLLPDLCFTANAGRSHFQHRLAVVTDSVADLREQLAAFSSGQTHAIAQGVSTAPRSQTAFLFTGQGAQYPEMGRQLYETQPVFRAAIDRCAEILQIAGNSQPEQFADSLPAPGFWLLRLDASQLNQTAYAQPALFAIEYALYELWRSWGVAPAAVLGHSLGEYVAACVAGVFSLEDGLKLVAARGRLMQTLPPGRMVAVFAGKAQVEAAIVPYQQTVSIAAINGPENIVISGEGEAIGAIAATLRAQGIQTRALNVSHAFHSPLMQPMLTEFAQVAQQVKYSPPQIDLISNSTGERITNDIATPDYWCRHIRQPVLFADSLKALQQLGYNTLIECGPNPVLLKMGQAISPLQNPEPLWLPSLNADRPDWQQLLQSLGQLYVQGNTIAWDQVDRPYFHQRISLPTYPFQHQRYWLDAPLASPAAPHPIPHTPDSTPHTPHPTPHTPHPLLGHHLPTPLKATLFQSQISTRTPGFLADHRVYGVAIVPATAYLEMALAAGKAVFKTEAIELSRVTISRPLTLPEGEIRTVQLIVTKAESDASFEIYSLTADPSQGEAESWMLHCSGTIELNISNTAATGQPVDLSQIQESFAEVRSPQVHYQICQVQRIDYGASFRGIEQVWRRDGAALGKIQLPSALNSEFSTYRLHPALLDACCQVVLAALPDNTTDTYLPLGLERLQQYRPCPQTIWSQVQLRSIAPTSATIAADVQLFDRQGNPIAHIHGLTARRASRTALLGTSSSWQNWLYQTTWVSQTPHPTPHTPHPATWLIFADTTDIAQQLADRLQAQQQTCILVFADRNYQHSEQEFWINPHCPDHFQRLLEAMRDRHLVLRGVIHLWSIGSTIAELERSQSSNLLQETVDLGCQSTLYLVQALLKANLTEPPRLWLVTSAAQFVRAGDRISGLAQAPLWGLGKTIALEHPELRCTRVDLDSSAQGQQLFDSIWFADDEDQLAWRDGDRYVARLSHYDAENSSHIDSSSHSQTHTLQLEISERGALDNLLWRSVPRLSPAAGEIAIRVRAAGLNFRDILNGLGLYPGDAGLLGLECAGEVVAVGQNVTQFQVGDAVVAIASGSLSQYVTIAAHQAILKPDTLSFAAAATIPTAFLTAQYTLHDLANIAPGDRVLIHAAAGGVGLAAIQIAQQAGATVFATASPGKWAYLRAQGVQHVMNSRSLDFASAIMTATQGQGVDIVLNCLSGEFIPASLSVLVQGGQFIEIGKQGVWSTEQVAQVRPDVTYVQVDLMQVTEQQPAWVQSTLHSLMQQFQAQHLQPLPFTVFAADRAVDACRTMQQAKHIGKLVIMPPPTSPLPLRPDSTYAITGGLGGLGLRVAEWLVANGAKHLLLISRHSPTPIAQSILQQLQATGASIQIAQADVADRTALEQVLQPYIDQPQDTKPEKSPRPTPYSPHPTPLHPLRGIIHAAGLINDGTLQQQTWQQFQQVMAAKVQGAWNLHELTQQQPIDFFVLFSSAASLLGSAGQGNYAAANAFLDALAQARQVRGLPGLSINWGAWSQVGLAARSQTVTPVASALRQPGMGTIAPAQGLDCLGYLLSQPAAQVGILPIDKSNWQTAPALTLFLSRLIPGTKQPAQAQFLHRLQAAPVADRSLLLSQHIQTQVARVLGLEPTRPIDVQQGFAELGIDSLTSVELKNRLQTSLGRALPSTLLFDYPTLATLTAYLSSILLQPSSVAAQAANSSVPVSPNSSDLALIELEQLSDLEAEALLQAELQRLRY